MASSLGYHTMELSLRLTSDEASQLIQIFAKNKDCYFKDENKEVRYNCYLPYRYYTIRYRQQYKGLSWTLRYCRQSPEYMKQGSSGEDRCCTIKAKINPKILIGLDDYITAADGTYLNDLVAVFNWEAKKISPILKDFGSYSLTRIDYCINFDLENLRIFCHPAHYMMLIQQANIPNHFSEYKEYRGTTHRKKPGINSFYLVNNSVRINCYWKYHQLQKQFPSVPYIDDALSVIRFEIQCLYLKSHFLQKQIKDCDNFEEIMSIMLSDKMCEKVVISYYYKTIGKGDYYSLNGAREKIKSMNFSQNKENRLLNALKLISLHHGISKTKSLLQGKELDELKRSINDLGEVGVNPVTIPRDWRIKSIPNLLTAYLADRKRADKEFEEYHREHHF